MPLRLFNGADTSQILAALQRDCEPEQIVSVQFRAEIPPIHSLDEQDQWVRLQLILGRETVYQALGISSLPPRRPARFYYARGLEVIGTLANFLMSGGVYARFVDDYECALTLSREFLDNALLLPDGVEAYSSHDSWCEWFIGDGILDATVLLGNGNEWWLLTVTGTD